MPPETPPGLGARAYCQACERPLKTCLCDAIVQRRCDYRLVILQDPTEARHALSSAPLLAKSIVDAQLHVGEVFAPETVLGPQWREDCLLLFPGEAAISAERARSRDFTTLLLLDGTWRKVARLMHLNPWLAQLPRLALTPQRGSAYRLRKSPRSDGLATIEAAVEALELLQPGSDIRAILGAFEKMLALQIRAMGEAVFQRNYGDR